ncbi:MAG TPA: TetR/AcrR family transcriptional regulator [Solirubrobacterales bacterium]|jgi:AcrR family transcriptional regulator
MDQKRRLRVALASLTAESGYDALTVRALIRRANVSTSTFYKHYRGIDDCFAGLVGMTIRSLGVDIRQSQSTRGDVIGGLRTAVWLLMDRLAQGPEMAQTVFIESHAAGPQVLGEMNSAVGELEVLLAQTFTVAPRPAAATRHLAAGLVAGVVGIVRKTARAGRAGELPGLADELTDWMLSVANEDVVAFCVPRSRPTNEIVDDELLGLAAVPTTRESVGNAGNRAMMTAARLAATSGLASLTSVRIRKEAGLSRREFERYFTGVEDCFLDAIESVSRAAADAARGSAAGAGTWERWMYKAMNSLCSFAADDSDLSRLVLLDITAPGRAGLLRREDLIDRAAEFIRAQAYPERRLSEVAATASISAVWRIAETEVASGRHAELPRVAPAFAYMVLAARCPMDRPPRPRTAEPTEHLGSAVTPPLAISPV